MPRVTFGWPAGSWCWFCRPHSGPSGRIRSATPRDRRLPASRLRSILLAFAAAAIATAARSTVRNSLGSLSYGPVLAKCASALVRASASPRPSTSHTSRWPTWCSLRHSRPLSAPRWSRSAAPSAARSSAGSWPEGQSGRRTASAVTSSMVASACNAVTSSASLVVSGSPASAPACSSRRSRPRSRSSSRRSIRPSV